MIGLTAIWTFAFFAANALQCLPVSENWALFGQTPGACIHTTMMYLAQAWSDVFTDIMILSMPLPWVYELPLAPDHGLCSIDLETSVDTNAEDLCGSAIPTRSTVGILEKPFTIILTSPSVVGAGIAKLVVFNRIVHGMCVLPSPT